MTNHLKKFESYIEGLNMNANYQPVVLRYLVKNDDYASREELAEVLRQNNLDKKRTLGFFKSVPVFNVLLGHKENFISLDVHGNFHLTVGYKMTKANRKHFVNLLNKVIRGRKK